MKIQQFLAHHGIALNPFADEDAQTDPVFKEHCLNGARHPSWDKIYGDPSEPATSIVFGEKGAGKTALRLQIVRQLNEHNQAHPARRLFIVEYDDFNPFLDRFAEHASSRRRRTGRVLDDWKLWDHMDAILSLSVTSLVDRVLVDGRIGGEAGDARALDLSVLDRHQKRDLLLLAACYDQSTSGTPLVRWQRLRKKLRFPIWRAHRRFAIGVVVSLVVAAVLILSQRSDWLATPWPYLAVIAGWVPWLWLAGTRMAAAARIARHTRVLRHDTNPLRKQLMRFTADELANQPLPDRERTDDRYELLIKLQSILRSFGFHGLIVLVDRVDEPHLINGSAEQMKALLWPMLDNKFLKHPGLGLKLLLPIELSYFVDREDRDFYQRARLDKQNMVPSLQWTGEALYDVATARVQACAEPGRNPALRDLFDDGISDRRLIDSFRSLRVPRHLFKFMYRVLVAHSSAHTDENPEWKIAPQTFESTLALYQRDQDAFDRGAGAG